MRGLVLEGGAARGAYQAGVLLALERSGISFDGVVGTSIGAINGAMFVAGATEELVALWEKLGLSLFGLSEEAAKTFWEESDPMAKLRLCGRSLRRIRKRGGIAVDQAQALIARSVDERKVRDSGLDFGLVTTNLSSWRPERLFLSDIPRGSLSDYLMASAFMPLFRRKKIRGRYYLDGCFVDNLPYSMLLEKGYEEIWVVRIHGFGRVYPYGRQREIAVVIEPSCFMGTGLDFLPERNRLRLEMGYRETMEFLQGRST